MARSEPQKLERIAVIGASWAAYFLSRGLAVRVRSRYNEFAHGQYGRGRDAVLMAAERWYSFRELGAHLGNLGPNIREVWCGDAAGRSVV